MQQIENTQETNVSKILVKQKRITLKAEQEWIDKNNKHLKIKKLDAKYIFEKSSKRIIDKVLKSNTRSNWSQFWEFNYFYDEKKYDFFDNRDIELEVLYRMDFHVCEQQTHKERYDDEFYLEFKFKKYNLLLVGILKNNSKPLVVHNKYTGNSWRNFKDNGRGSPYQIGENWYRINTNNFYTQHKLYYYDIDTMLAVKRRNFKVKLSYGVPLRLFHIFEKPIYETLDKIGFKLSDIPNHENKNHNPRTIISALQLNDILTSKELDKFIYMCNNAKFHTLKNTKNEYRSYIQKNWHSKTELIRYWKDYLLMREQYKWKTDKFDINFKLIHDEVVEKRNIRADYKKTNSEIKNIFGIRKTQDQRDTLIASVRKFVNDEEFYNINPKIIHLKKEWLKSYGVFMHNCIGESYKNQIYDIHFGGLRFAAQFESNKLKQFVSDFDYSIYDDNPYFRDEAKNKNLASKWKALRNKVEQEIRKYNDTKTNKTKN